MNDGTKDELRVSFPATPTFTRIGRVAVAGLALRLGIEISMVEQLRLAVDAAVNALHGPGRITVEADWRPGFLEIRLSNSAVTISDRTSLANELASMVRRAIVDADSVVLEVQAP